MSLFPSSRNTSMMQSALTGNLSHALCIPDPHSMHDADEPCRRRL